MTDLVLAAALAFMAALLGAASLAIFLLYRGWKSNRAQITELKAQIAAQQIAALTNGAHPPVPVDAPEPVRRRRHLTLYIGGGVAAIYTSCRDSVRNLFRRRPVLATAAVATVATVGTAAALVLVPGDSAGDDGPAPSTASTDTPQPGLTPRPTPGETSHVGPDGTGPQAGDVLAAGPPHPSVGESDDRQDEDQETPATGSSTTPAEEAEDGAQPGGSGPSAAPPATEPDAPAPVQPPASTPPTSRPQPGTPPPAGGGGGTPAPPTSPAEEDDGGLCVKVPPLVDLCLLSGY